MRYATNYTKLNQHPLIAYSSWVSYHAKAIRKEGKVSPIVLTYWKQKKEEPDLSINLAASFMNCIDDFLPGCDMLRIPDSGCILPLSTSTRSVSRKKYD